MNILVIGEHANYVECREKFGAAHTYHHLTGDVSHKDLDGQNIVFDFGITHHADRIELYSGFPEIVYFLNVVTTTLSLIVGSGNMDIICFGFAGLPSFISHQVLEVSLLKQSHEGNLSTVCKLLNVECQVVKDSVGMVTPRVICMIINEAYIAVYEGTASREDIDIAMKLGTNYPYGPFEWCSRIGTRNVFALLSAMLRETGDERYAICPLLREECFHDKTTEE